MAGRIEDYAIVGDMQSVALIGTDNHGQWRIAPGTGAARATRRYAGDTLILETDWETPDGVQPCPASANRPQPERPRRRTPTWSPR